MSIEICPSKAAGHIKAPPSKSCAHRLLLCAALAEGKSTVSGLSYSEDILATLDCLTALGAKYEKHSDAVTVTGPASSGSGLFPCRESGSTLRFFIPAACALRDEAIFTGTPRLMARGVGIYEELFRQKGVSLQAGKENLTLKGRLTSGEYAFRGDVSSQFVSGLMFALPLLEGESVIKVLPPVESRAYIDLTACMLGRFGVEVIEKEENVFSIPGGQRYHCADAAVEGDWSNAAFLFALSELGGAVTVDGLDEHSLQSDRACLELFARLREKDAVIDISGCPDLGPVLFALAAAEKGALFTGTKRLRIKESDRAQAMALELRKFGVSVTVEENSVRVCSCGINKPTEPLFGHNDHRIVMALSVLASKVGGVIDGAAAVNKSYPSFFEDVRGLGVEVHGEI